MKDSRLVKIEGDKANHFNRGRLCVRGRNIIEAMYHPARLQQPLIRSGERGENRWREASLPEAADLIAGKFLDIKKRFGAESVIFCKGTAFDIGAYLPRLCYGFGSPNYFGFGPGNGNACYRPRVAVSTAVMGRLPIPDLGQFDTSQNEDYHFTPPKCILIWGANPVKSNPDGLFGGWITDLMKSGGEIIVVDPQKTELAVKAKHWLRLTPGTDGALALGMLNVIFEEELYDKKFCGEWVTGLEDVKAAAAEYPPEKAASITGVTKNDIVKAARFFAESNPANMVWGVSVDMNPGCIGTILSLLSLMTVTGNIENPGGMVLPSDPFGVKRRGDSISDFPEIKLKRIGAEEYPLIETGNPYAQPDVLLDQMESGEPYPIKAAWIQGTSIIPSSFADPERVIKLFKSLDFIVFADIFMNPGAMALADVILPAAMYPEKDSLYVHFSQLGAINKAVEPLGECRSDGEIILEIGRRIAPDYFPWNNIHEWLDYRLKPAGMTFAELKEKHTLKPRIEYAKHASGRLRPHCMHGFDTPSGKIELNSSVLRKMNLKPVPHYRDYTCGYWDEYGKDDYPFILTSGSRSVYYFGSQQRNIAFLRNKRRFPIVHINTADAQVKGVNTGDWLNIYSPFGNCKMKAEVSEKFPKGVIHCDSGWWFPERKGEEPELFGVRESNVNALLPSGLQGPGGLGYPFRCFICNVEKIGSVPI